MCPSYAVMPKNFYYMFFFQVYLFLNIIASRIVIIIKPINMAASNHGGLAAEFCFTYNVAIKVGIKAERAIAEMA